MGHSTFAVARVSRASRDGSVQVVHRQMVQQLHLQPKHLQRLQCQLVPQLFRLLDRGHDKVVAQESSGSFAAQWDTLKTR